ncbi:MAG: hypothetical protein JJT75_03555 [Opitutales bacterium]|nr:hypothetical protein [Opitutales bacterium]MCH8540120.1 hypothetical protein [Opitutales bacterium]
MQKLRSFALTFSGFCLLSSMASTLVSAGDWPFGQGEAEGILWFWENQTETYEILDEEGNWARDGEALLRENARLNRHFGAETYGGFIEAPDLGPAVAESLADYPDLIVEMGLYPEEELNSQGVLFWLGTYSNDRIMKLAIEEGGLAIHLPGKKITFSESFAPKEPHHLILHVGADEVHWWVDGERQGSVSAKALPRIEDPWDVLVAFGGIPEKEASWQGAMDFLAVRRKLHEPQEVYASWQKALVDRSEIERVVVEARLVQAAEEPNPSEISEYGEGIFATIWEVSQVIEGDLSAGDRILAWNWYILDRMVIAEGRPPEVGEKKILRLSSFDTNPQVKEVQQIDAGLDPVDLLDLPEYFAERRSKSP